MKLPVRGRWRLFQACTVCPAAAGQPCQALRVKPGVGIRYCLSPHAARTRVPFDQRPYHPRAEEQLSRLAQIVLQVMRREVVTVQELSRRSHHRTALVYRMLNEKEHPLSIVQTRRLLDVMGYDLHFRATPRQIAGRIPPQPSPAAGQQKGTLP